MQNVMIVKNCKSHCRYRPASTSRPRKLRLGRGSGGAIITRLRGVDFIGMDVVAPGYDIGEITALKGASMAAFYMCLLTAKKQA